MFHVHKSIWNVSNEVISIDSKLWFFFLLLLTTLQSFTEISFYGSLFYVRGCYFHITSQKNVIYRLLFIDWILLISKSGAEKQEKEERKTVEFTRIELTRSRDFVTWLTKVTLRRTYLLSSIYKWEMKACEVNERMSCLVRRNLIVKRLYNINHTTGWRQHCCWAEKHVFLSDVERGERSVVW